MQQISDPWSAASSPPSDPWQPLGGTPVRQPHAPALAENSWLPRNQSPALQNSNALVEGWLQNTAMTNGNAPPPAAVAPISSDPWLIKPAQPQPIVADPWLTKPPAADPWLPTGPNPNQNAVSHDPWAPTALNVNILIFVLNLK